MCKFFITDYKAISTYIIDDGKKRNVIYHTLKNKGKKTEGVEVYTGENYVVGSKDKSNSRAYKINELPIKYKDVLASLKKVYKNTKWSAAKYINEG